MRSSATSGVSPIRSSNELATTAARHGGQEDHGAAVADRRVEPVARAHVLAVDVDVHERLQLALGVHLAAERWDAGGQVLEQLADGRAARFELARTSGLGP